MKFQVLRKFNLRFGAAIACALIGTVAFQNCGNVKLSAPTALSSFDVCADANKDLLIVATNNTASSAIAAGRTEFQIYEKRKGDTELVPFVPEDAGTEWPPRWFHNDAVPGATDLLLDNGKIFSAIMDGSNCAQNKISAKFRVCGNEFLTERSFSVGTCAPTECSEYGVVRPIGQNGIFYKTSEGSCQQNCESIERTCLPTGLYGPPLQASQNASDYRSASCSNPPAALCTITPTPDPDPIPEPDPTPGPAEPGPCDFTEGNLALVKPAGAPHIPKTFEEAFAAYQYGVLRPNGTWGIYPYSSPIVPTYPSSLGYPTPIGAPIGSYVSISFTTLPNTNVSIIHDRVQVNSSFGYVSPRVANGLIMTISTCPGDFREAVAGAQDQLLKSACRGTNPGLTYSTDPAMVSNAYVCYVKPGVKYYLNISVTDFATGANTCNDPSHTGCEVQMNHR